MREKSSPFPIESEYPLVLADDMQHSYCAFESQNVIAHLNLWPRRLIDTKSSQVFELGLVGNVATAKAFRGRGVMRQMFQWLDMHTTKDSPLDLLVLWSDLDRFYQTLGFQSQAQEFRFVFPVTKLGRLDESATVVFNARQATDESLTFLGKCLQARCATPWTVQRSPKEFLALLNIPATHLIYHNADGADFAYAVVGKGCDMAGVIHEWGGENPQILTRLFGTIANLLKLQEIMVLAPGALAEPFLPYFNGLARLSMKHPMALLKDLRGTTAGKIEAGSSAFADLFIWGLDSI